MDESLHRVAAAYEGLERPESFAGPEAILRYREAALDRSRQQSELLAAELAPAASVLEIGCGNGRLLVDLAQRGAAVQAVGIDVAASRIEFARTWARDLGLDGLRFEAADALTSPLDPDAFDAALCITGALGYFGAAQPRADGRLLERMAEALTPGGLLCLELYPHVQTRRLLAHTGGEARVWHELPPTDPWRFYLSRYILTDDVLLHEKRFVHRETGAIDEGREEQLFLYDPVSISDALERAGFSDVRCLDGWSREDYADGEVLVVLARLA